MAVKSVLTTNDSPSNALFFIISDTFFVLSNASALMAYPTPAT